MHHTDHIIPDAPRPLPTTGTLYFVGIGGAGMSAIAQVLAERGRVVVGADPGITSVVRVRLEKAGATIYTTHDAANVSADVSAVIVSDAIPTANPEVLAATERGIPVYRRPEVLGNIVNAGRGIAIAGTHGKTTTTGMVASILIHAGLDPTVLIGGDLPLIGGNARNGGGDFVVAESCEAYDGFLYLHPEVAVILNIEADHLDYHGDEAHVIASFERFTSQIKKENGALVYCADDAKTEAVATAAEWWVRDFGYRVVPKRDDNGDIPESDAGQYFADDIETQSETPSFTIIEVQEQYDTMEIGRVKLGVPGLHNISNALAAASVAVAIGVPMEHIIAGLESFTGTGRRFEKLGDTATGVTVIDDYAHHPTELRATLSAARSAFPGRRIVAVFQPHLPSRTRDLMDDFAASLSAEYADAVFVTDIYLARETAIPGVSSEILAERIAAQTVAPETVRYVADKAGLPDALAAFVEPGDVVITLGAGDIRAAGEGLLKLL